jgi:hypothetical protein
MSAGESVNDGPRLSEGQLTHPGGVRDEAGAPLVVVLPDNGPLGVGLHPDHYGRMLSRSRAPRAR